MMTLGSLFSGTGGFELGGLLAGIEPRWLSEIEPFALLVTHKRFPGVKQYGDVCKLKGSELEPVDIITFGSPCQDLSVSGKRAGLSGHRSGLYVEAVRVIREMLEATKSEYPKFCVFENVDGLLSSNNGADFLACLDMIQGLGFLPDVNILDAQHMGVPQRRKRVYITWLNVDYILKKKTNLSASIMLQLLTELLLLNLGELLRASGIELRKLDVPERNRFVDLVKRRIDLFSLQRVAEKAGADFHERIAEVKAKEVSREELIEWAISWILDRIGKETPLIVKMMGVRKVKNAYTYIRGMRTIKMMLLGNVLAEDVKESLPKLGLDELKGMSAGFGKPVDFDCEDDEMAEGLRNLIAGEIFYLRVGKKKIADYLSEDEKEMYADYLADNPRLVGRSW